MCIAALAWHAHPRWALVVAANRDEFHARPALPLGRWADAPQIIGGRDGLAGGTWLGVNEALGRLVLVTNRRTGAAPDPSAPSRGGLVRALLDGADPQAVPLAGYNPCTLLVAGPERLMALESHPEAARHGLLAGIHGVSNGPLDTIWPKTAALSASMAAWLAAGDDDPAALFAALADTAPRPGSPGPDAMFTPVFITGPAYGTRASTVVLVGADGAGQIIERRFGPDGAPAGTSAEAFHWRA